MLIKYFIYYVLYIDLLSENQPTIFMTSASAMYLLRSETDQTNSATSNPISIELSLKTDLNYPEISKTILSNDPALPLTKNRIERHAKWKIGILSRHANKLFRISIQDKFFY